MRRHGSGGQREAIKAATRAGEMQREVAAYGSAGRRNSLRSGRCAPVRFARVVRIQKLQLRSLQLLRTRSKSGAPKVSAVAEGTSSSRETPMGRESRYFRKDAITRRRPPGLPRSKCQESRLRCIRPPYDLPQRGRSSCDTLCGAGESGTARFGACAAGAPPRPGLWQLRWIRTDLDPPAKRHHGAGAISFTIRSTVLTPMPSSLAIFTLPLPAARASSTAA